MTYVKVNGNLYPATIDGKIADREWDNRESKAITLEMDYATASALFVDGAEWSIVEQREVPVYDENEVQIGTKLLETEWDNSEFTVAGSIVVHRNGTVTVKMGKHTDAEMLTELLEVLNND